MREISGDYAQAFLRAAWESAPDGAQTFKDYITAALVGRICDTASGRIITGTSGAGQSVSFYIPAALSPTDVVTPVTIAKLCNVILKIYEWAAEKFQLTDEAEIFKHIMRAFEPATQGYSDYGSLRLVTGYQWT